MTPERLHVSPPRFEHLTDALGIGVAAPRLSWIVETPSQGWRQAAYAVEACTPEGARVAATEQTPSDASVLVPWPFAPLTARQRLLVRVRVWGEDGEPSPWSELAPVEAGLLTPDDWTARFITPEEIEMRNASRVSRLLEGENFVRVRSFSGKPVLFGRGGICAMGIVVDGLQMRGTAEEINAIDGEQEIQEIARRQRLDREAAERQFLAVRSSIDEIVSSLAVQAIEIYPSLSAAPPEIMRAASSMACGVVVISTGRP